MKLFFTSVFVLSCVILSPPVPGIAQEQPLSPPSLQEQDKRAAVILEKLNEKVTQYRENHTLLLKTMRSKEQHFKNDLTTPKGEPKEYYLERLVVRRPLPDKPSESGLFVIGNWAEVRGEEAKKQVQKPKEVKAYPFVSELDFLLAKEQGNYQFSYGGQKEVEGRKVEILDFVTVKYEAPRIIKEKGKHRYTNAPRRGRILVDAESYDVRQIDWTLIDNYELHMGAGVTRKGIFFITHPGVDIKWEKWDTTFKYRKYDHPNLKQELWLPEMFESFWVIRGARRPVCRISVYFDYKRFHTDVKVLDDVKIVNEEDDGAEPENDRR